MINLKVMNAGLNGVLTPSEFMVLYIINNGINSQNEWKRIYLEMLSDLTGISSRQLKRVIISLVDKGFIEKKTTQINKVKKSTVYRLNEDIVNKYKEGFDDICNTKLEENMSKMSHPMEINDAKNYAINDAKNCTPIEDKTDTKLEENVSKMSHLKESKEYKNINNINNIINKKEKEQVTTGTGTYSNTIDGIITSNEVMANQEPEGNGIFDLKNKENEMSDDGAIEMNAISEAERNDKQGRSNASECDNNKSLSSTFGINNIITSSQQGIKSSSVVVDSNGSIFSENCSNPNTPPICAAPPLFPTTTFGAGTLEKDLMEQLPTQVNKNQQDEDKGANIEFNLPEWGKRMRELEFLTKVEDDYDEFKAELKEMDALMNEIKNNGEPQQYKRALIDLDCWFRSCNWDNFEFNDEAWELKNKYINR